MPRLLGRALVALCALVASLPVLAYVLCATLVAATSAPSGGAASVGTLSGPAVGPTWLAAELAAPSCPSVPWGVLGALGFLASGSGRWEGRPPPWPAGRGGRFGLEGPDGHEALEADARRTAQLLCAAALTAGSTFGGLALELGDPAEATVIEVLATALGAAPGLAAGTAEALAFSAGALGLPYRWGGNGPQSYDCSGLMVAAWRAAGVALPRTAQAQHDALAAVIGTPVPGDLVFFGLSVTQIEHVGIEIGDGLMIDAPYTGAFVRIEPDGLVDAVAVGRIG